MVTLRGTAAASELTLDESVIAAPFDPLALFSDGPHLLVASASSATLERDGLAIALPRDPRAVLLTTDGTVRVAHATGSTLTTVTAAGTRSDLPLDLTGVCTDGSMMECMTMVTPPSLQSYALATYAGSVLVPSVSSLTDGPFPIVTPAPPPPQNDVFGGFDRSEPSFGGYGSGNVSNPITFRIDVIADGDKPGTSAIRSVSRMGVHECTLPRGMAVDEASHQVWIACLGDGKILRHEVKQTKKGLALTLQKDVLEIPFVSAIAYDAASTKLVAYAPFERTVTIAAGAALTPIALPKVELDPEWAAGRRLFATTDKRISAGKKACLSCHPDGGDDGLAWDTPQGKRRTLALAGRIGTGKIGWEGRHATLEVHVARTIATNLRGKGLSDPELASLLKYVRAMKAPLSRPVAGAAARGRTLFSGAADCSTCHDPDNHFSDGLVHDVGGGPFRTPPLLGIAGRGRFFHDGRYRTLDELLAGTNGRMGQTASLSADDRAALTSYLATL
jgi:mono/diheme cytochrome c family protein